MSHYHNQLVGLRWSWKDEVAYVGPAEMGRSAELGNSVNFGTYVLDDDIVHLVVAEISVCSPPEVPSTSG